jgi:hypothetical protein
MSEAVVVALIGAGGAVLAALLTAILTRPRQSPPAVDQVDSPPEEDEISAVGEVGTTGHDGKADQSRTRYTWQGHSAVSVIRRLAKEDWTFSEIRKVFNTYDELRNVTDTTIRCQLGLGGEKRGKPADLTDQQLQELTSRR